MTIQSKITQSLAIGILSLGGVFSLGIAEGAHAQQSGLVNVDISNVANNIARNLRVDVSQIPVTVQAPIGVAANVCGVSANVLAADIQDDGTASCDAQTTSQALNQIVQRRIGG